MFKLKDDIGEQVIAGQTKCTCTIDYEREYYRLSEMLQKKEKENEELRKALLKIALKL